MYKPKTLFTGFRIGLHDGNLYVAIPNKYFRNGGVEVEFDGEVRGFNQKDALTERSFNDKFKHGEHYTLYYYFWKKVEPEAKVIEPEPEPEQKQEKLF